MTRLSSFAEFVTQGAAPDESVKRAVRLAGIDTLGCVLLGVQETASVNIRRAALDWGNGVCSIYGGGMSAPAPIAALCNAISAHTLDFDDWEEPGNTHPSAVLFPALWALCHLGEYSGTDVITAYSTGFEIVARLGEVMNFDHYNRGWHSTATLGVIGAAAASARMLGLSVEQTTHALSLAITQASGYTAQFGSHAKPIQAGVAARDGVMAAQMAAVGMTGQAGVLEAMMTQMSHGNLAALDDVLGRLDGLALSQWGLAAKRYPSCGYTHRLIDCACQIESQIGTSRITSIHAELPDFHAEILPFRHPENRQEAMFSIPYCVATALKRGGLTLSDLTQAALSDPEIADLIECTTVTPHPAQRPEMNFDPDQPDRLSVMLEDGRRLQAAVAYPKGAPQHPMSEEEICQKFETNSERKVTDALITWDQQTDLKGFLMQFSGQV